MGNVRMYFKFLREHERVDFKATNRNGMSLEQFLLDAGFDSQDAPYNVSSWLNMINRMRQFPITRAMLAWDGWGVVSIVTILSAICG